MGDQANLPSGPPVGRRPLPQAPTPSAPNRMAGNAHARPKRERPVITVVDAKPMDQVGFRGVQAASPLPAKPAQTQEEPVKMRPPPPTRPPSSFRRSMPITMDKVGLSTASDPAPMRKPPPSRQSQKIKTTASSTFYMFNDDQPTPTNDCNAAETRPVKTVQPPARKVQKEENKSDDAKVPDIIAGQRIKAPPPRNVDLLSDVPASTQAPQSPPQRPTPRGVPVFPTRTAHPLPADRGPPPPLPKKSPSVPNLFTMKGETKWALSQPISVDDGGVGGARNAGQPSPTPRAAPRGPTVIRANRSSASPRGNEAQLTANEMNSASAQAQVTANENREKQTEGPRVPTIIRASRPTVASQDQTGEVNSTGSLMQSSSNVRDQKESSVTVPTIIRAVRPSALNEPERRNSAQSVTSQSSDQNESETVENQSETVKSESTQGSGYVKALSDKLAGGVRVFPFAIPKSTSEQTISSTHSNESQNETAEKVPTKIPPKIKPKPALLPKPALKPKPATATKPNTRPKSAAFANSMKFAQSLEVATNSTQSTEAPQKPKSLSPREVPSKGLNLSPKGRSESEANTHMALTEKHESQTARHPHIDEPVVEQVPKRGPMKATYRPTIIRAAIKTREAEMKTEQDPQEFSPVNKRLSTSCANMGTNSSLSTVEFSDNTFEKSSPQVNAFEQNQPSQQVEKIDSPPQPVRRQRPTIIRPASTLNLSTPTADPKHEDKPVSESESSRTKSVSFATADVAEPEVGKARPRSLHGGSGSGILKPAMSMPDISRRGTPPPRPGAPPSRPSAPPSRRASTRTASESESYPAFSPISPTSVASFSLPPDSPGGKTKPPPRPSEGPKRRGSSSSSAGLASPMNKRFSGSTPNLSKRGSAAASPGLPQRPGPGHPLFHYVAQGPHAVALFDYDALHDDELSFKAGSVVELVRQKDADWLVGRSGNREGMFPVSFVDVIEPLPAHLVNTQQPQMQAPVEEAPPPDDTGYGPRCRARFDYDDTQPDDLAFKAGDVITLFEYVGDDWLKGELRGKVGIFPLSFVEIIEDIQEEEEQAEAPPPLPTSAPPPEQPCMPTWDDEPVERNVLIGTALHDFAGQEGELTFQTGAKIHLISRINADWLYGSLGPIEGSFPANFIDHVPLDLPEHQSQDASPPPLPSSPPPQKQESSTDPDPVPVKQESGPEQATEEWCLVKFDYPGESAEDLSITAGQRVQVIEHVDSDWLRGRVGGREGLFPVPFVDLLPDSAGPTESDPQTQSLISHPDNEPSNHGHNEPISSAESRGTMATILHDFEAQTEGDLDLAEGGEVLILEKVGDDWLRGRMGDKEGIFPAAYVEVQA